MGKKIRAAQASIVAALLAAGGTASASALHTNAKDDSPAANTIGGTQVNWGDRLIGFLKLDGFPAFLKADGFEALTQFYKENLLSDAATLYDKWAPQVSDLLALYQKADGGPLAPILGGLESFYKENNIEPLMDYLKTPGAMDAYIKFENFFSALQQAAPDGSFQFFYKETGIAGNPLARDTDAGDAPS